MSPPSDDDVKSPAASRTPRILIVDDSPDILSVIERILTLEGYETISAMNGEEALKLARSELPDVVLLDWLLPGRDGLDVCREIKSREETRGTMVLLVTGRGSVASRVEGFNAGADDYIPKPFSHPELLARIRSSLRIKKLTDDLAQRNRQLVESQTDLVRSEKMATIGLLAAGVAHEFNNIMAGISGYAQLARKNSKYLEQLVEVALTQTARASDLTRSLSTYSRKADPRADSSVSDVVASTLCLVKKELEERRIRLTTDIGPSLRARIQPGKLQEVLLNLILNAIQAMAVGGHISVCARPRQPDSVAIHISDTGCGIPERLLHRVFDPFFTTKGALGGGSRQGTGLGLSVCANIVQAHGGDIDVESTEGAGSTFKVLLPASIVGHAPAARPKGSPRESGRTSVLLVEDDPFFCEALRRLLDVQDVRTCSTGEAALGAYRTQPADFVILDLTLEGPLDGLEVMRQLIAEDPEARVVISSGRTRDEIPEDLRRAAHGHLMKPYRFEDLMNLLGPAVGKEVPELLTRR